jgi:phosphatidate cytidylyltransferase
LKKKFPYKLFERISPHKTWVGSIGGGIVVLLTAIIFSTFDTDFSLLWWLGLGAIVAIFATWGDLIESMMKRQLGIKDSGKFLPGHGGVLDRFDSALLAIPASVIYVYSTLTL